MATQERRQCCAKCQHFHRDFNRYYSARQLADMEVGYCMARAPRPCYEYIDKILPGTSIAVAPLVDEDALCGVFAPRQ